MLFFFQKRIPFVLNVQNETRLQKIIFSTVICPFFRAVPYFAYKHIKPNY